MLGIYVNLYSADVYGDYVNQSSLVDELLVRLKVTIEHEVAYMKELMELMGTMDTIFVASQIPAANTQPVSLESSASALAVS